MVKKIIMIFLSLSVVIAVSGCQKAESKRYSAEFLELFDTVSQVVGYTESKEEFEEYTKFIYDELAEYHKLYDIYNTYEGINNVKTINDNAGIAPVKVDKKIIDLLLFSKEVYELTNGKVNVAMGAVLKVWHDYRTIGLEDPSLAELPPMSLLVEKSKHTDMKRVIIDVENSTVYLEDKDMSLDVGGIAKGYSTEQVAIRAREKGFTSALYSIGGNVRSVGIRGDDGTKWNVGVQNPDLYSEEDYIDILSLSNLSLVTSGVYQRYYTVDGKEYHHIIDNETLMPSDYFTAVSIMCEDSGIADALSTAVFNMSFDEGLSFVESLNNTEAVWVLKDGTIKSSSGYGELIKK